MTLSYIYIYIYIYVLPWCLAEGISDSFISFLSDFSSLLPPSFRSFRCVAKNCTKPLLWLTSPRN